SAHATTMRVTLPTPSTGVVGGSDESRLPPSDDRREVNAPSSWLTGARISRRRASFRTPPLGENRAARARTSGIKLGTCVATPVQVRKFNFYRRYPAMQGEMTSNDLGEMQEKAMTSIREARGTIEEFARENPRAAIGIAVGVGF